MGNHIISLRIDGDDFEIVGHEVPSDERPEQTAQAPATPEQPASLEAVERLLHERREDFGAKLRLYLLENEYLTSFGPGNTRPLIRETSVLGVEDEIYRVRVVFNGRSVPYIDTGAEPIILLRMEFEAGDFEIVGHAFPSDERPEQTAAQATDPAEASGEFLGN